MALVLLLHIMCRMDKLSIYLLLISLFTIIWGATGITAYVLDQDNAIYHHSDASEKLTHQLRNFSINVVHWIFIMKYYHTSAMLPKIFHDIMIDDYVKEGKFIKRTETSDAKFQERKS